MIGETRRVALTIRCPRWDIRMEGIAAADGRTVSGTYQAYVGATGTFTMVKR